MSTILESNNVFVRDDTLQQMMLYVFVRIAQEQAIGSKK